MNQNPDTNQPTGRRLTYADIYIRLGEETVMIPIPHGEKGPRIKDWTNLTVEQIKQRGYLTQLKDPNRNIGILLGESSNHLCTIDVDQEEALAEFCALNPWTSSTLMTKASRGANVWVRIEGDYPASKKIAGWGEWRADGSQTIISGTHPKGCEYRAIQDEYPKKMRFSEITWPDKVKQRFTDITQNPQSFNPSINSSDELETEILKTDNCNTVELNTVHCVNRETSKVIKERYQLNSKSHQNQDDWEQRLKTNGEDAYLAVYEEQVGKRCQPVQNGRNDFVVNNGKRLFYAAHQEVVVRMMMDFYEIHKHWFKASPEQHERECKAMLEAVEKTYVASLDKDSKDIYSDLGDIDKAVFRILRDLAIVAKNCNKLPFISSRQLSGRLGVSHVKARKLFKELAHSVGVIRELPNERHGQRQAMVYEWLLPLPNDPPPTEAELQTLPKGTAPVTDGRNATTPVSEAPKPEAIAPEQPDTEPESIPEEKRTNDEYVFADADDGRPSF